MGLLKRFNAAIAAFRNPTTSLHTGVDGDDSPDIVTARVFGRLRRVQMTGVAGYYHVHAVTVDNDPSSIGGTSGSYLIDASAVIAKDRAKFFAFVESRHAKQ